MRRINRTTFLTAFLGVVLLMVGSTRGQRSATPDSAERIIERVTTAVPFPRGLAVRDDELSVLARGRVRGAGGVTAAIDDRAGTIFRIDTEVSEPIAATTKGEIGEAVRTNGEVFALPTEPPFHLWDRTSDPPERDRFTDRPYCTLRYHGPTKSFYLCAFSGVDKPRRSGEVSFSKNLTDAILRYDTRTNTWYEIERHDIEAGGSYPHHDPVHHDPPHGWLNGPNNCLAIGDWLYAVAKDNSVLVRYDLSELVDDPEAGPPTSEVVMTAGVFVRGKGMRNFRGHSALAYRDNWLYIAYRTSSVILRVRLDENFEIVQPTIAEIVARFDPYDPITLKSADLTDMCFDEQGRLYVVSAKPARVYRFSPKAHNIFDARSSSSRPAEPWVDMAARTKNPNMKSENVLVHDGWLYVTSGDGYAYQQGAAGTVYRVQID